MLWPIISTQIASTQGGQGPRGEVKTVQQFSHEALLRE